MNINLPDLGLFKGMATQDPKKTHKRNYPSVDNKHQFDHEHPHPQTDMLSMSKKEFQRPQYVTYQKANRNSNQSSVVLGQDKPELKSVAQSTFQRHSDYRRGELVKRKEAHLILGQDNPIYKSTTHDQHRAGQLEQEKNINYKLQTKRFDPILGIQKTEAEMRTASGFESFNPLRRQNYTANNHTRIPQAGHHFDIITGRRLPY